MLNGFVSYDTREWGHIESHAYSVLFIHSKPLCLLGPQAYMGLMIIASVAIPTPFFSFPMFFLLVYVLFSLHNLSIYLQTGFYKSMTHDLIYRGTHCCGACVALSLDQSSCLTSTVHS